MLELSQTKKAKFVEVVNDTWDYLFLADPRTLLRFRTDNGLQPDLLAEFTSTEFGDRAVEQGAMIPLSGINNFPYTVYFSATGDAELLATDSDLQHHQKGYRLRIESGQLFLFTVPYLQRFDLESIERLERAGEKGFRQAIRLSPGWYQVEVLAGQTRQEGQLEPTLEFVILECDDEPAFSASINYPYCVRTDIY